jgi:prepilin-type N-terminal cleavage/methylation domain-containing protein
MKAQFRDFEEVVALVNHSETQVSDEIELQAKEMEEPGNGCELKNDREDVRGFTIVELIFVVSILGTLLYAIPRANHNETLVRDNE